MIRFYRVKQCPRLVYGLLLGTLLSCHPSPHHTPINAIFTVHSRVLQQTLHFTGTIQPIHQTALTSPVEANIESVHAHYGELVKRNQLIFTLNSSELQKRYNDTVTEYLKAKDSFTIARAKFIGTQDLWRAGLLSKNNYLSERSSVNTERVRLMQSTRNVSELLEKIGQDHNADDELAGLSFSALDKVHLTLMSKHNLLQLKAPSSGMLLYPPKTNQDSSQQLTTGSNIKTGQVLAIIGDMRGIRVEIDVPEVDIGRLKLNMPATVRGIAFEKTPLIGTLVAINAQASDKNANALPTFTATIEVNPVPKIAQSILKVGMSATVELRTQLDKAIFIPLEAVSLQNGHSIVRIKQADGTVCVRRVTTGAVEATQVVIEAGLHNGDVIVYERPQSTRH